MSCHIRPSFPETYLQLTSGTCRCSRWFAVRWNSYGAGQMDDLAALNDFIYRTAADRGGFYREQAEQLRGLAEAEQVPSFKENLLEVAAQYERMAAEAVLTNVA